MKVYWGNHGGWRWAWGLEVARLRLSVGTARYPEYITALEMLVNMFRLERWPGGGMVRFGLPLHTGLYIQVGVNHPPATATAAVNGGGE